MEKIGFIGGSMFFGSGFLSTLEGKEVETEYGKVDVLVGENIVYIQRHGKNNNIPPHRINHRANIAAFKELGATNIISINSVGSLRSKTKPGTIVIPEDYIGFEKITFFDKEIKHITPGLNKELREKIIGVAKKEKIPTINWGVYFQSGGPRLETKAEVNMIKGFAQMVGMTMASEATLAKEMEMNYAAVCSVDNYAHGIVKKDLTNEQIEETRKKNAEGLRKFIEKIIEDFVKKVEKKKDESSGPIHDFIKSIRGG